MENLSDINFIAVVAGAIVAFLVGWLWYSPKLFGEKWAEGSRVDLGSAEDMPVFAMAAQVVALLLLSTLIGLCASVDALITAVLAIVAVAAFVASAGGFVKKTPYAIIVDVSYIVLSGLIMIASQAIL